jgi:acylphosphatase
VNAQGEEQALHRVRLRARISGRVQGVGFRWWARSQAERLGLTGWVRNDESERAVEVLAEGEPHNLDALEQALHAGPPGSKVERVEAWREPPSGEFVAFEIER